MKKRIAIVGGGMLGMTLAPRLNQRGFDVTILEASPELGGLASPMKIGDYKWDRFYHVILMSDSNLIGLLEELDLKDQVHWQTANTGFYTDGRLYSMSNVKEFLIFPPLKLFDRLRLGATIFYASRIKAWEKLERVPVAEWLTKLSGERTFNKMWLPLLKSKLGEDYRVASAAFIWATIARMYAARRSGLKQEMFGYVDGGCSTVISKLKDLLNNGGIEILCSEGALRVESNGRSVKVLTQNGRELDFDDLLFTIQCTELPGICPELSTSEKQRFSQVTYHGILCAAVVMKKPLAGYYITNITDEWVPFTAVIEMTALVNNGSFGGNSLIYLPLYMSQDNPFWDKNDEEVKEAFLSALEKIYPSFQREDVLAFEISKENGVFPISTLNYSIELLPPTTTSLEHVFVVNSAQIPNGTMNVNEIVGLANRKAREVVESIAQRA